MPRLPRERDQMKIVRNFQRPGFMRDSTPEVGFEDQLADAGYGYKLTTNSKSFHEWGAAAPREFGIWNNRVYS